MKVLMVTEFFPPVMGGLEHHVAGLCRALAERRHTVKVVTLGWKGLRSSEFRDGYEITRLPGLFQRMDFLYGSKDRRFHPPLSDPIVATKMSRVIESFRPHVIHCHGWITYSALQAKRKYNNIPLVVTLHDYGFICPKRTMLREGLVCQTPLDGGCVSCSSENLGPYKGKGAYWAIKRNIGKLSAIDKYIAVSSSVKNEYHKHLAPARHKIRVIPNFSAQEEPANQASVSIRLPDDFILFVGTLSPSKGVDILVDAFNRIHGDVKLVLIGMSDPRWNCRQSDRLITLVDQPHHLVMEAWRRCRFGVVPSVWPDSCPTVALEAMSSAKAVVASDIGGLRDIVRPGETGVLVPPGDVAALAQEMGHFLREPEKTQAMGKQGRQRFLAHFSIDKVISEIEKSYFGG